MRWSPTIWTLAGPLLIHRGAIAPTIALDECRMEVSTTAAPAGAACRWLVRAAASIGLSGAGGKALHVVEFSARSLTDQSDHPAGPYIMAPTTDTVWLDPATAVERVVVVSPYGGRRDTYVLSPRATFHVTDSGLVPDQRLHGQLWSQRAFDPWAVLAEWVRATDVRVAGPRRYGGYDRTVLERSGAYGIERLFLDARTATPVKLERDEPNYFLGQTRVEYVYATWSDGGAKMLYPVSVTRLVDGRVYESRFTLFPDAGALVSLDSAPALAVPDSSLILSLDPQLRFGIDPLDTVKVGPDTYLLAGRTFTSVVSLEQDTVFLMDAPIGEVRARQEHDWVTRLFPGRHPVVLITLNHVWPHIAGLRYWIAHGATVVAPRAIVPFLHSVLARHWKALPDDFERERAHLLPRIAAVDDSALLGAGRIQVYAMEGINGEGVLLSYIRPAHFVWASDHIQVVNAPNIYVEDVRETVARHGLSPHWTSGPHFRLVAWPQIDTLPHILGNH